MTSEFLQISCTSEDWNSEEINEIEKLRIRVSKHYYLFSLLLDIIDELDVQ